MVKLYVNISILLWYIINVNGVPPKKWIDFHTNTLLKVQTAKIEENKALWYKVPLEYELDDKETIVIDLYIKKSEADEMPKNGASFKVLKRAVPKQQETEYKLSYHPLASGNLQMDVELVGKATAKLGVVEIITDDDYVFDIRSKANYVANKNIYYKKKEIGLSALFGVCLSLFQQIGVQYVTLDDASHFDTENKYDRDNDDTLRYETADSKLLRSFQGKEADGFPSTYSRSGFVYADKETRNKIKHDMNLLHKLTAQQAIDAVPKGKQRTRMIDCFRQFVAWWIARKRSPIRSIDKSFVSKVGNGFGEGLATMWDKKTKKSQKCYIDIINILTANNGINIGDLRIAPNDEFQIFRVTYGETNAIKMHIAEKTLNEIETGTVKFILPDSKIKHARSSIENRYYDGYYNEHYENRDKSGYDIKLIELEMGVMVMIIGFVGCIGCICIMLIFMYVIKNK